ncbi:MAG: DUF5606 domain-containing protein [Prevotellaceae bacterium]|nr:DUF5606 domain-containing protein [Prevotellaceae bacterium]
MQIDLQKILSASGYPGLYRYLSQGRQGIIVENLINGKRSCFPPTAKVSSLSDITIFTSQDDMMLKDVLLKIKEKENNGPSISAKSTQETLIAYFDELIPTYDKDKFFPSHMKKIIDWYNILQANDMLEFEEKSN